MWLIGAFLAGLYFIVRPLPGVLRALRTGVLIGKGYGSPRITREAEPERFKALLRRRVAEMTPGFFLTLGAIGWFVMNLLGSQGQLPPQG